MGLADTVTKAYMKDNSVFADALKYRKRIIREARINHRQHPR